MYVKIAYMTTNIETPQFDKPELTGIPIYIDGQLNRTHELARYGSYGARLMGYAAFKALEGTLEALDVMMASTRPQKPSN